MSFWTLNCVISHFHIADDYYYNKAEWTILKVAFLVFVPVVAGKWVCEEHNIGTQCGATTTNTATETVEHSDATNIQKNQPNLQNQPNQQNSQKFIRQLEVVPSLAEVCQNDPDGYQAAAFVPSKVPRWRRPPYLNILIPEHHITPHMIKVNVMAKLNTVPDSALSEIGEYLDIWTFSFKVKIED